MQMSVAIELYGSYDPVETPKPLWGSPGAELSTWATFQFCCETAIHRTRIASRPSRAIQLYSAIQRYTLYSYTSLYSIQPLQHPSAQRMPLSVDTASISVWDSAARVRCVWWQSTHDPAWMID